MRMPPPELWFDASGFVRITKKVTSQRSGDDGLL